MKKLEKAWIFIWAGAMLLFGLLTVNGLRFQYGDTVRTIVRGVDDLKLGSDLTGGLELALQSESGLPAEQQLLDNAREVLMKRLDYLGIQNAEVTVDSEESRLLAQKAAAQSAAAEMVRQAEKDGASLVSQAQEAARRAAADALRQAEAQAETERQAMLDRTEKDCDALRAVAMARMDGAMDYLLEKVVKR